MARNKESPYAKDRTIEELEAIIQDLKEEIRILRQAIKNKLDEEMES